MTLRRAWFIAACFFAAACPAAAQFPPQPQQPVAQFPPVGGQQPAAQSPPAAAPQQGPPPCVAEFFKLRNDTEKKGVALRAASERHATPKEACGLFNTFTAAEAKLIKYATDNSVWCSIPNEVIENLKAGHTKAMEIRAKVCEAANRPQAAAPHQPTLSDALGAPVPDAGNIKTGRGTFDTLTGSPLGTK